MKIPPVDLRVKLYGTFRDPDVWIEAGMYSFTRLRDIYNIQSHFKILDLACGAGRICLPLVCFLDPAKGGHYYGLDVDKEMMDWCSIHFNFANASFAWADVRNSQYRHDGTMEDKDYKFPYEDNLLDFGCAFSLFTHLLEPGSRNYLSEISRILKPKGKFMLSGFLFNSETEANIMANKGAWTFKNVHSSICRYDLAGSPEATVGYTQDGFTIMAKDYGFSVEHIEFGNWSEVPHGRHDEILLIKD